jgi:hypothetical protein
MAQTAGQETPVGLQPAIGSSLRCAQVRRQPCVSTSAFDAAMGNEQPGEKQASHTLAAATQSESSAQAARTSLPQLPGDPPSPAELPPLPLDEPPLEAPPPPPLPEPSSAVKVSPPQAVTRVKGTRAPSKIRKRKVM